MRRVLWYMVLMLLFSPALFGQNGSFTASVNKNRVSVNETFQITYTLNNLDGTNLQAPSFKNFNVVGGPNRSQSIQIINGSTTKSTSFSYYLQPQQEGTYTIGAATLEVNGKTINSNSVTVTVVGEGQAPKKNSIDDQIRDNVFVRVFVDREQVYQGEQVNATFKLYTRMDISNTSLTESPAFKGFWTQEMDLPNNINFRAEVYNGVQYNAAVIKKVALFPQRSGDLEIEPMGLQTVVRVMVEQPSWRNMFGVYKNIDYKFQSNSVKVHVKPLPTEGKQGDFSGFVGSMEMNVSLDKTETETDDPITLSISLKGTGNLGMVDAPDVNLPNDFEVFDPKVNEKINKSSKVGGTKSFDYLVIPRRPGEFKLPPITFTYFDLEKQEYVTLKSQEYQLKVTGEASTAGTTSSNLNKEEVELLGQDIRFIKNGDPELLSTGHKLLLSWEFAGASLTPLFCFFLLIAFRKRQQKMAGNTTLIRQKKASKVAVKLLKESKKHLDSGDQKAFYDAVARALWGYWGDRLNIEPSARLRDAVEVALTQNGVSAELVKQGFEVLDDCEMALYAPSAVSGGMEGTYSKAQDVINKQEEALK